MAKKPASDPTALMARAMALRDEADSVEREAIREALRRSQGLVLRAAQLLGVTHGWLSGVMREGRRYHDLAVEAEQFQPPGYKGGKPSAEPVTDPAISSKRR